MRPNPKEESLRWFTQAEAELKDAIYLMKIESYYLTLFLCQQSAEKALKAFIYLSEEEHLHTHSVTKLLEIAISIDGNFDSVKKAGRLDDYYIPTRYLNGLPGVVPATYYDDPDEAQKAVELAESVINLVREKIDAQ